MTSSSESHTYFYGRLRIVTRVIWLLLVGLLLATFATGIPLRFNHLKSLVSEDDPITIFGLPSALEAAATLRLSPHEADTLQSLGISLDFYAGYILAFDIALVLIGTVIGFLIFWRRPDDWLAVWISIINVLLGTNAVSLVAPSIALVWPGWILVTTLIGFLGMVSNVHILFISPDGRFVPRWTQSIAAGFTGVILGIGIYTTTVLLKSSIMMALSLSFIIFPIWFGLIGLGLLSQIYRYVRVSDLVQRQQTKWVASGFAAVALGFTINAFFLFASSQYSGLLRVLANLVRAPLVNLCMVFLPVCLAISIFRYRLWDIDLVIRRTLVYSLLTGLLGLLYFGGIAGLQAVL